MKKRLDVLLFEKGFFDSREKARIAIMEGLVYVNKAISDKPGTQVPEDALLEVKGQVCPYVSRGGYKLAGAIEAFFTCQKSSRNVLFQGAFCVCGKLLPL